MSYKNFKNIWCVFLCVSALTPGHSNSAAANLTRSLAILAKLGGLAMAAAYLLYEKDQLELYKNTYWRPKQKQIRKIDSDIRFYKGKIKEFVNIIENFQEQNSGLWLQLELDLYKDYYKDN